MRVGTKSILFGVHNFVIHTVFLAVARRRLYGFPHDPRLWLAFLLHDTGYFGKRSMEGREGETHVELGARIMGWLFGAEWAEFCRRHSRYYARSHGLRISRLCVADKPAFVLTPSWLYLPLARASGELWEYMERSKDRQAGSESFTPAEWSQVNSQDPREWLKGLQSLTYRWVLKNRFADEPDLRAHRGHAGVVDRRIFLKTEAGSTPAEPRDACVAALASDGAKDSLSFLEMYAKENEPAPQVAVSARRVSSGNGAPR